MKDLSPKEKALLPDAEKIELIATHFREIMLTLGLDLDDPSLAKTPYRVARMYVNEVFQGLNPENFPHMTTVPNDDTEGAPSHFVFVSVSFTSFCEHHFVPMHGYAYVAYRPNKKLLGLSKIPRLVRYFARRPQLQERLTAQVAEHLSKYVDTEDVAVSIAATHFCVVARGIEDQCSKTITNVMRGGFENDPALRQEFFEAIKRERHP
jgi:GTP cyclohydrolase IA